MEKKESRSCSNCKRCKNVFLFAWYQFRLVGLYYCTKHKRVTEPSDECEKWKLKTAADLSIRQYYDFTEELRTKLGVYEDFDEDFDD